MLDEASFPVDLKAAVHTAVVVVFMLHFLMLLQVSLLCGRVGAEITVIPDSLVNTSCVPQQASLVRRSVVAEIARETHTLVNSQHVTPHVSHSGGAVRAKVTRYVFKSSEFGIQLREVVVLPNILAWCTGIFKGIAILLFPFFVAS